MTLLPSGAQSLIHDAWHRGAHCRRSTILNSEFLSLLPPRSAENVSGFAYLHPTLCWERRLVFLWGTILLLLSLP